LQNVPKSALNTNFKMVQRLSDYYIQNASFYRIDNITFGWNFEVGALRATSLQGRVYASVQNPFVITKYSGLDPEIFGGIDKDFYPRPITCIVGVNLTF